jgi:hypothetical protein
MGVLLAETTAGSTVFNSLWQKSDWRVRASARTSKFNEMNGALAPEVSFSAVRDFYHRLLRQQGLKDEDLYERTHGHGQIWKDDLRSSGSFDRNSRYRLDAAAGRSIRAGRHTGCAPCPTRPGAGAARGCEGIRASPYQSLYAKSLSKTGNDVLRVGLGCRLSDREKH